MDITIEEFLALPLSGLLGLSLVDMREVSKLPVYEFDMLDWHNPKPVQTQYKCYVCMAGAVMANTFKVPSDIKLSPLGTNERSGINVHGKKYKYIIDNKLSAIDCVRNKDYSDAFKVFSGDDTATANENLVKELKQHSDSKRLPSREKGGLKGIKFVEKYEAYFTPIIDILKKYGH